MKPVLLLLCFLFDGMVANAQGVFTIAGLNTENFFDCQHDDGKEDEEFLPDGGKKWTYSRFKKKLRNISKELISIGGIVPPDVIALVEVENDSVLIQLTRRSILRRAHYNYVMTESDDPRGIDVALLYLPETFKLLSYRSLKPVDDDGLPIPTRSILHVSGRVTSGDTLHLFVCHFSSKVRGVRSERKRRSEAICLRKAIDSLQCERATRIIVLGDFNDLPISQVFTDVMGAKAVVGSRELIDKRNLYNLALGQSLGRRNRFGGTYKFDGRWEMLDQCFVSGLLLDTKTSFFTSPESFHVWSPDFLLEKDDTDCGLRPRRTYLGYRYHGGYSDHLPIFVRFTMKWKP